MLSAITWPQLQEWMVFAELEPFDEERADLRAAQMTAAIFNVNRDSKKRPQPIELSEVLLRFGDTPAAPVKQTWQQMKKIGRMVAGMFSSSGGKE